MSKPGFRIYTKVNRPPKELVDQFIGLPVANISDNMGRIACMDTGLKALNKVKMVGTAVTVRVPAGDNLMFHKAMELAQPGDIIVVDGEGGITHALCGEIMMRYAISKGIRGFVVDGCVRDLEAIWEMDFGVYARGIQPKGPYKNGPGEINSVICAGGQVVSPGDIICCDMDGIVIVRPQDAQSVLELSQKHNDMEVKKLAEIEAGGLKKTWMDQILQEQGCEIINDIAN